MREELGMEIEVEGGPVLLATHTYRPDGIWVLAISFLARLVDGEPSPADDVAGIRWVSAEDIPSDLDFAWEHDRNLVRRVDRLDVGAGLNPASFKPRLPQDGTVHSLHVRLAPGPELLGQYTLVEQHPVAGNDGYAPRAPARRRRCLGPWTVDRVAERPCLPACSNQVVLAWDPVLSSLEEWC